MFYPQRSGDFREEHNRKVPMALGVSLRPKFPEDPLFDKMRKTKYKKTGKPEIKKLNAMNDYALLS